MTNQHSIIWDIYGEANLVDKQPLVTQLSNIVSQKTSDKRILDWFLTHYVRWFISPAEEERKPVRPHKPGPNTPDWAHGKTDLYDFAGLSPAQHEWVEHATDYFLALDDRDLNKTHKQNYDTIVQQVAQWDQQLASKMSKGGAEQQEGVDVKTIKIYDDGFRWVKLVSKAAYKQEGDQMGHCVAGYADRKSITILSLRDPKNGPHVTVELQKGPRAKMEVHQIKGKQNIAPDGKYVPYVVDLIKACDYEVVEDGENIGMVEWDGRSYFEDSEQWLTLLKTSILPKQNNALNKLKKRILNGDTVDGDVNISGLFLEQLPDWLANVTVTGTFYCYRNRLTTLRNMPKSIGKAILLFDNRLRSLQGAPRVVHGTFGCEQNLLTSLDGAPRAVEGDFNCSRNELTTLRGAPAKVDGSFYCQENRLSSLEGLPNKLANRPGQIIDCSYNQLTSLRGAPNACYEFACSANPKLTTLEGAPETVRGAFNCYNNKSLVSLVGGPTSVGDFLCFSNESLVSLEGAPQKVTRGMTFDNCTSLMSLKGSPHSIAGGFSCSLCKKLKSLDGAPRTVGRDFIAKDNKLKSLEGIPTQVGGGYIIPPFKQEQIYKAVATQKVLNAKAAHESCVGASLFTDWTNVLCG